MSKLRVTRGAVVGAAIGVFVLLTGQPALAQSVVNINPGNVPTAAAAYIQNCDPNLGGGPYGDADVWVFNLPGDAATTGVFESVTGTFNTPDGAVKRTITHDGGAIVNNLGTSRAWIWLPAGWTLTSAVAMISGTAEQFTLAQTCTAKPGGYPAPRPSVSTSPSDGSLPITGPASAGTSAPALALTGALLALIGAGLILLRGRGKRPTE